MAWKLTGGRDHITDLSNAAITGLMLSDASDWDDHVLERLRIPRSALPTIVDSTGMLAVATALQGAPPLCGIAGDQQSSLIGQGGTLRGTAKISFGTGGMLDLVTGPTAPLDGRGGAGTFPIVCWRRGEETMWGIEAIMLSAGTNVQWLRDDLQLINDAPESEAIAAQCETTEGVVYVPAQLGIGTPHWDYGARGVLTGLTRGTGRPHIVRAVLEGVAHRGVDLLEATEADSGLGIGTLRIDGGMSANAVFAQALANFSGRRVEVCAVKDATTLGAALLAGLALGTWSDWSEVAATWKPKSVYEPAASFDRSASREQWTVAADRARHWYPELSAIDF
jgi:glycerol kinase